MSKVILWQGAGVGASFGEDKDYLSCRLKKVFKYVCSKVVKEFLHKAKSWGTGTGTACILAIAIKFQPHAFNISSTHSSALAYLILRLLLPCTNFLIYTQSFFHSFFYYFLHVLKSFQFYFRNTRLFNDNRTRPAYVCAYESDVQLKFAYNFFKYIYRN